MMDAAASPTNSEGGHDASRDKDLISKLPKDILVRILSFLGSTKEAIKTSILSKRWRDLWLSIPKLSFDDPAFSSLSLGRNEDQMPEADDRAFSSLSLGRNEDQMPEAGTTFLGSIERALSLRNLDLVYLSLWLHMQVDASRLHSWLSDAVKHNVQELILSLPEQGEFVLPDSLLTSKALSSFELAMECTLKVPSFVCFSNLKLLYLAYVAFEDDLSAQQLLSGCPLLEELRLFDCDWKNITVITIENPTLRRFIFSDHNVFGDIFDGKIIISASNLETLYVAGLLRVELSPCNLPSLNSATIDITIFKQCQRIVTLLSGLQNVKSLDVSSTTLQPLLYGENLHLQGRLPTFYNLTQLKACPGSHYYTSGALIYILENSPNLESLEIPRAFRTGEQNMIYESVRTSFQSSLKQFIIYGVGGEEDEVELLKYMCENVPSLKYLGIHCNQELSDKFEKQEEICHLLRQLRGASDSCVIEFFPY